ncbi:hypothetical protein B005_3423 [Nocardiopsis alba ATCC BAA-2165]|uniref:Uncharacterized protein n=1 Tax=Nocardiopsis alba (strain ATCC BAA-2165 / BE74) TaxID=1205910 RepID=J7L8Q5_NOCAA|nr:hypothetical protein B005_3423 [Nocardiopsis alba ATCC BAA-2165]
MHNKASGRFALLRSGVMEKGTRPRPSRAFGGGEAEVEPIGVEGRT